MTTRLEGSGHQGGPEITVATALVVYAYAALALALPFVADLDPPFGIFMALWLVASCVTGVVVPRLWVFAIPIAVFVVLLFVSIQGYTESEFLSDALSSIALFVLAAGELVGLAVGYTVVSVVRARD